MTFEHWTAFSAVAALNIVTPGPTNLLIMNTGARLGRGPIVSFAVGNVLALGIIGLLVTAGLSQFIVKSAMAMQVLRLVGGGYLIWLGIKLWVDDKSEEKGYREIVPTHAFRLAFTNAITNPKPLLFFGTVLPLFVPKMDPSLADISVLVFTFMSISFVSLNIYGSIAARMGQLLKQARARKVFNRLSGTALIGYGGALVLRRSR
ncbi:LysE family translocator [Burkholderia sp. L27(2015)]|uniref:LysE family translocator n=1 Tax=Burkholderia sp. L27(2015) TaxID=1641858 RepID=UPI00131C7BD2|nr:LysE family translocator [Burkholderia sp. L27(2015)]